MPKCIPGCLFREAAWNSHRCTFAHGRMNAGVATQWCVSLSLTSMRPPIRPSLLRRIQLSNARFASSSTENAAKKAQEALGSAQKQAEKFASAASKQLGPLGQRLGGLLGGYREPLVYNAQVFRELLKQVYIAEQLAPPTNISTIQAAYSSIFSRASSPAYWRQVLSNGDWAKIAIYGLEAYGIFSIGEMVGRRSIVGYKLK